MKLMFASDIHGSALYAKQLLARMEALLRREGHEVVGALV